MIIIRKGKDKCYRQIRYLEKFLQMNLERQKNQKQRREQLRGAARSVFTAPEKLHVQSQRSLEMDTGQGQSSGMTLS